MVKYLGNGASGCVFNPSISCHHVLRNKGKIEVSKVFLSIDVASEEFNTHKHITNKIDPNNIFTVKVLDNCSIKTDRIKKEQLSKCTNFNLASIPKELGNIIYEYGGIDLSLLVSRLPFSDLLEHCWTVFWGLSRLNEIGYAHLDIKPENIIFNEKTLKMSIIDFGLLQEKANIYNLDNMFMFEYPYQYFPPEFNIIYQLYLNNHVDIKKCVNTSLLARYVNNNIFKSIDVDKTFIKKYAKNLESFLLYISKYTNKIDVYMLGSTLLVLSRLSHQAGKLDLKDEKLENFYYLITNMIIFNPHKRWTINKSYKFYKNKL